MKNTFLKAIPCIVFFTFILSQSSFAQIIGTPKRTLALVVGVSDYKHLNDLKYAHKDAEDFAGFLTSKDGLNLPKSNVALFTDKQATKNDLILQGLDWLEDELQEGEQAFIFFSGHGDITNSDYEDLLKTGYLLTYESEKDKLELTALRMDYFLERFNTIASKKKATVRVIMDVCHAGIGTEPGGIISFLEFGRRLDKNKQIIITSCGAEELSWEYDALQNSCFSYFFLQGLKGAADKNKDYRITLEELREYSEKKVKNYVNIRSNYKQSPEFKGSDSHPMAFIEVEYTPTEPAEYDKEGAVQSGTSKGIDNSKSSSAKVEKILKKIEQTGLSSQEIQSAYELYLEEPEKTADQKEAKRKIKRDLATEMIEKADKVLTTYFDKEDEMMHNQLNMPVSEYYLKATKLLGEDHFLYKQILGKYFFMEAIRLKALNRGDSKVMDNLNSSLTLDPSASYTLNELGNVYFAKGELDTAKEYYQKANDISPAWGKNLIKANKALQQRQASQHLFTSKSPSGTVPTAYETVSSTRLASASVTNPLDIKPNPESLSEQDMVFHIQLAATGQVNRAEFKKVEDLGPINPEFNAQKNLMNTLLGPFETEEEARTKLKKVRERGFKDAFLVQAPKDSSFEKKLDEKRVELKREQAAAMPYQVRIAAVKTFNKSDFTKLEKIGDVETEPVSVNGKTLLRVLMRSDIKQEAVAMLQKIKEAGFQNAYIFENKVPAKQSKLADDVPTSYDYTNVKPASYKIRVASVSRLVENQFSNLEDLGHVYMDVVHDKGLIRISLGDFQNKKKALEALEKVKRLGYKDAFIQK